MAERNCKCCGDPLPAKYRTHCEKALCQATRKAGRRITYPDRTRRSRARWAERNREKLKALDRRRMAVRRAIRGEVAKRWRENVRRGSYGGSLEEYAYYIERKRMGCRGVPAWRAWQPKKAKKQIAQRTSTPCMDCGLMSKGSRCVACSYRHKYRTDHAFRLYERLRRQFKKWLKGERLSCPSVLRECGYTREQLKSHIEKQFRRGMNWNNYGRWHIDHITPKHVFNRTSASDQRACWALSNLRPVWASENQRKGGRITHLV